MSTALATAPQAERRSVLVSMASRFGMEPQAFEATLRATVVPESVSREQFAAFLLVAKEYGLNPLTKEIYAFPTRGGGIQPIVGVDGWANLINSHPACDGFEFTDTFSDKGELVSITCRIFRKDRAHPVEATEYMAECKRNTDTWKQWPRRMLRHKALIQAARYAFGFSGIIDPDEWERHPERAEEPRQSRPKAVVIQATSGTGKALPPVVGQDVPRPDPYEQGRLARREGAAYRRSPALPEPELAAWRQGWQDEDSDIHAGSSETPHDAETGEVIEGEVETSAEPEFEPEQWLSDINTLMAGAKTMKALAGVWNTLIKPRKAEAGAENWTRAETLYTQHEERITTEASAQ